MSGHVKSIFFPDMDHGISAHRASTKSKNVLLNTPSSVRPKDKYKDTGISTDGYYLTHYMAKSCLPHSVRSLVSVSDMSRQFPAKNVPRGVNPFP